MENKSITESQVLQSIFPPTPLKNPILYPLEGFTIQLKHKICCVIEGEQVSGLNKFSLP